MGLTWRSFEKISENKSRIFKNNTKFATDTNEIDASFWRESWVNSNVGAISPRHPNSFETIKKQILLNFNYI